MAKDNKTKATPETTPAAEETKATPETTPAAEETKATEEELVETKKIRFLLSPAGQFLLPYNVGQVVELPANQADEIVDMKYAEFVK